jgi:transposase-like protein
LGLLDRAKAEGVSLVGPDGLLAEVTKTVLQAALDAEMADHLGYDKGERPPFPAGNQCPPLFGLNRRCTCRRGGRTCSASRNR